MKSYLDDSGRKTKFKDNYPGYDWSVGFVKRHQQLSHRLVKSTKPERAKVTPEMVRKFFENFEEVVQNVPPENILNYDESAFVDNAGESKVVLRRGSKYPVLVRDNKKTSISVMCAGTAAGIMLPPYTVYKADCIWSSWVLEGLHGARYNRSRSGWFDMVVFEDWFNKIAYPHLKRLPGRKILIGDNLSSHLSYRVIRKCERENIRFILFPPNATQYLQPLDVAVFRSFKISWRKILLNWKKKPKSGTFKENFPRLLKDTVNAIANRMENNLKSGFRTCGLYPFNPSQVLKKIPGGLDSTVNSNASTESVVPVFHTKLVELLKKERFGTSTPNKTGGRRKKINVAPGKSVLGTDFDEADQIEDDDDISDFGSYVSRCSGSYDVGILDSDTEIEIENVDAECDGSGVDSSTGTSNIEVNDDFQGKESAPGSSGQSRVVVKEDIKVGVFVIVRYSYSYSGNKGELYRFYVGCVRQIVDADLVDVWFMRKYLNRMNEYVYVTKMNNGKEEDDTGNVLKKNVVAILKEPKIVCGRHVFSDGVCEKFF